MPLAIYNISSSTTLPPSVYHLISSLSHVGHIHYTADTQIVSLTHQYFEETLQMGEDYFV